MEKPSRPVDLPLLKIRLPIGGIVSIIHRVTGVLLVLALPLATYWLDKSLASQAGFESVGRSINSVWIKILALLLFALFVQHLISGIRHLLLDLHIGIGKAPARFSAWAVLGLSVSIVIVAAWLTLL